MRSRRTVAWGALALAAVMSLVAGGVSACRKDAGPTVPQGNGMRGMPVEAAHVRVGTVVDEVGAVGSLQANESVVIRSEISGRISEAPFTEGRAVAKGDLLFTLDPAEAAAQVAQIAATVELNRSNLERAKPLLEAQMISPQAFDQLAAKLKESEASLTLAQERLNKATIRAPFGGRVGLRQVSPGDYVQPGQALVNLEDLTAMKVDFRIPETVMGRIAAGRPVTVRVDAFPGQVFRGAIRAIEPRLDEATRTILVRARVDNPGGQLRPGMFARVAVALGERPDAVLVPEQAVVPMGDEAFVYRVVDGKAAMVKVVIGQRKDGEAEVVSGLSPADVVVTGGQTKIRDGAPVMVIGPAPGAPSSPPGKG